MLQEGRDLHIDAVLSNIMVGRRPEGYIADQLVPVIPVAKQSNVYFKSQYREAIMYAPDLARRAKGAEARKVFWTVSSDTYYAQNFALGGEYYQEDVVNADNEIKLRSKTARHVDDRLKMDYEMRIAALANTSTNVGTTFHVLTPWSNTTGSRPFDDLANMIEVFRLATTKRPNTLILPEQVATYVRRSDQIRDMLFGDRGGIATEEQLAALLKIGKVLTPTIFVNTAGMLETKLGSGTLTPVWGNKAWLAYVGDLTAEEEQDTWFTAFRWTDPSFGVPWAVRVFDYDPKKRKTELEVAYYQGEKVTATDLGLAIDSVV